MQNFGQIKSTVSLDQQTTLQLKNSQIHTNSMNSLMEIDQSTFFPHSNRSQNQELLRELDRLKRKIIILQKNKKLLNQQLILAQEQIKSQQKRAQYLQGKKFKQVPWMHKYQAKRHIQYEQLSIIVNQKQEYIQLISKQLQLKQRQIQILNQDNLYLKEELTHHQQIHETYKKSVQSELEHYRLAIKSLEDQISMKDKEILTSNLLNNHLYEQFKERCEIMVRSQKEKSQLNAENLKKSILKYEKLEKGFNKMQSQYLSSKQKAQKMQQTVQWYKKLLEQAKIQFIHTQLQQSETFQKHKQQNKQRNKLSKMLKVVAKQNKNDDNNTSCFLSTKTHRVMRTNTQITTAFD